MVDPAAPPATAPALAGIQEYLLGLRHVGYVVTDMADTLAHFRRVYALSDAQVQVMPPLGEPCDTRFAFIEVAGAIFELIEPISEHFRALLLTERPGINHVAWEVSDIDAAVARLAEQGVRPGHVTPDGPIRTPRFKMVYFDPETTGGHLVELIESMPPQSTGG